MMIKSCKKYFQEENASVLEHIPGYKDCIEANTLQAWLDSCYGMAGYASSEDFYRFTNPMNYCSNVPETKPLLVINSEDGNLSSCFSKLLFFILKYSETKSIVNRSYLQLRKCTRYVGYI